MDGMSQRVVRPEESGGFSVILAERVLGLGRSLGLYERWDRLTLGNVSRRIVAYTPAQRVGALMTTLVCGLRGIAPANLWIRPNSAVRYALGGRFPEQGTMHRWLQQATAKQAQAWRSHLHVVVREHGRFRAELWSNRMLYVDVDGQGLVARGQRFAHATAGYMDDGIDIGYQRYVAYVGETREVLDEMLVPANQTLLVALPEVVRGLNEVFAVKERPRVVVRMDSHGGSVPNIRAVRGAGYHYLCPLYSHWAVDRLKRYVTGRRGGWFVYTDMAGQQHRIEHWLIRRWRVTDRKRKVAIRPFATVYHDHAPGVKRPWMVLVSDLKKEMGRRAWERYHERSGTIEEFNDQSERAYHLDVMRTGNIHGLNVIQTLVGLSWNLTRWAAEEMTLPPKLNPNAQPTRWIAAVQLDMSQLMDRASHSGLRLMRNSAEAALEVEDSAGTAESTAWLRWLRQPVQRRLRLTG